MPINIAANALLWFTLLLSSILLSPVSHANTHWQGIVDEAKGQTVYFNAWGGNPEVNRYLSWAKKEIQQRYQVNLVHVKVDNIATSVNQLLINKQAGKVQGGGIDLIWVNGSHFKTLKHNDLLGAPFTHLLPNMALVNTALPIEVDFTLPVEGLEAPWGVGQLNFIVNRDEVVTAPTSAPMLLAWAKAHPGRFTYPKPPDFHGVSFLKQMLLELLVDTSPLYREVDDAQFAEISAPLWHWLDEIHPHLWRKGKLFPSGAAESRQLLDDGELSMALSFNPFEAAASAKQGTLPPNVAAVAMSAGALTNIHFLAIPFNAKARAGAMVVTNFLLSPHAQTHKADLRYWGDPTVLRADVLSTPTPPLFLGHPEPHPSWQLMLEATWGERYGH